MAVHVALASFEERKMEVIHKEITRIRESTQILNGYNILDDFVRSNLNII